MYYIAQVASTIGWCFMLSSYWRKGSKKILYFQLIACFLFAIDYYLLGAKTAIIIVTFEIIRDFLYIKVKSPKKIFYLTIPIYITILFMNRNNFLSLFSISASFVDSYALTKKNNKIVALGILTYSLWAVYDFSYQNYIAVIAEVCLIISNIIVLTRYNKTYYKSDRVSFSRAIISNSKIIDELFKINDSDFKNNFPLEKEKFNNIISNKNEDFIIIHIDDDIVGYINFSIINKREYNRILNVKDAINKIHKKKLSINKRGINYVYINSIVIKDEYSNDNLGEIIGNKILEYVSIKEKKKFRICGIIGIAKDEFDKGIFEIKDFKEVKNYDEYSIYIKEEN